MRVRIYLNHASFWDNDLVEKDTLEIRGNDIGETLVQLKCTPEGIEMNFLGELSHVLYALKNLRVPPSIEIKTEG